jgi:hypothetical protein
MSKCKTKEQKTKKNEKQTKVKKPLGFYIPLLLWSPLMEALP